MYGSPQRCLGSGGLFRRRCIFICKSRVFVWKYHALKRSQVLLQPPKEELVRRLHARAQHGTHFMPPSLLDSQLAALEVGSGFSVQHRSISLHFMPPFMLESQLWKCVRASGLGDTWDLK